MEDIVESVKKLLYVKRKETMVIFLAELIGILAGEVMLAVVLGIGREGEDYFQVGTMLGMIVMFMVMFVLAASASSDFNMMMSMNFTRDKFFTANLVYTILITIGMGVVLYVSKAVSDMVHPVVYGGIDISKGDDISEIFKPGYIILAMALLIAVNQILTIVFLKCNRKAFIVMWCVWMTGCVTLPRIADYFAGHSESAVGKAIRVLGKVLSVYNGAGCAVVGVIVLGISLIISKKLILRQQVSM